MADKDAATAQHVDVLVIGAGLSGIGAGYFLQRDCPERSYLILEARERLGGTWDLFRYPGIRSDSDMYTLGYSFKPWTQAKAIADGPDILAYLNETTRDHGIDAHIRYRHRMLSADWCGKTARWTVMVQRGGEQEPIRFTCSFLFSCSGYYAYDSGYTPDFAGMADFKGRIVHPQHWPEDLKSAGKRIIVIGSGATAVTLVPALAEQGAQVTMLQRSPTYMISRPGSDALANALRRLLPSRLAYGLSRWKNILLSMLFFNLARGRPELIKRRLLDALRKELGPDYDLATHFTPRYNPWDQRLCLVPDSDIFKAIRSGKAIIVTDHIERFTAGGILLKSGRELAADIIVTATGLRLQTMGGATLSLEGVPIEPGRLIAYKGMMYAGVPNLATSFGYTNASWTLKSDLTAEYVCRVLNHMRATGATRAMPVLDDPAMQTEPWVDFSSGYFQRALDALPRQGDRLPWKLHQNYIKDLKLLRRAPIDDGVLRFDDPRVAAAVTAGAKAAA